MNPQNSIPGAPPPPPEVKVRTMKSDIDSMAKSGGGLPQFQGIKIPSLSFKQGSQSDIVAAKAKTNAFAVLIAVAVILALAIVGYFIYVRFFLIRRFL